MWIFEPGGVANKQQGGGSGGKFLEFLGPVVIPNGPPKIPGAVSFFGFKRGVFSGLCDENRPGDSQNSPLEIS